MSARPRLPYLLVAAALACGGAGAQPQPQPQPQPPQAEALDAELKPLLQKLAATVESLKDYRVVMTKQQRIKNELKPMETLLLKHRGGAQECRYIKWLEEPHKGREAILCKQRYEGKMQVHQPGMLGFTMSVDPNGSFARSGNLRPVTQSGIFNFAATLKADASKRKDELAEHPPALSERTVHGRASLCLKRDHAEPGAQDPAPYPVGARELCFARDTGMPTEIMFWHVDGQLMEHYTFRDYVLNPGFTDLDFDTDNPDYDF